MLSEHDHMVNALRKIVVPHLRQNGFAGAFPHFRRITQSRLDLLTFQFDRHGGGFVIEISACPPEGITTYWGERVPPNQVQSWDLHPDQRSRLQPGSGSSTADWFRWDDDGPALLRIDRFKKTAKSVLPYLENAERWWANK
jgi:hypothetical protein